MILLSLDLARDNKPRDRDFRIKTSFVTFSIIAHLSLPLYNPYCTFNRVPSAKPPAQVSANPDSPLWNLVKITPYVPETMTAPPAEQDLMEITSTTFGIDEIDPKGDIVVKVGDSTEGRFMRVSIKTLSLASEVFNTMLGPKWIEGQTTHSAENPLALPEDDPQAMEILFKLAHLKIHNPDEIPTDCLPGLLVVCDKYGCFNTFQYWLSHTKERWFSGNGKPETTQELLQGICIAHIFDDSDKFSHFVGRLYKQASGNDIRAFMESSLCTIMSTKFQGMFPFASSRFI